MPSLTLYAAHVCPFAHRAVLAAAHHEVEYTAKDVDLKAKTPEFTAAYQSALGADPSSDGKVPTAVVTQPDGSTVAICESDVVMKYIDDAFGKPEKKLQGYGDALADAASALFAGNASSVIQGWYGWLMAGDEDHETQEQKKKVLFNAMVSMGKFMLNWDKKRAAGPDGGALLQGDRVSNGDVLVWPWIYRFPVLHSYRGMPNEDAGLREAVVEVLGSDAGPAMDRFLAWRAACNEHPSFKRTMGDRDAEYFVEQYAAYKGKSAQ